MSAVMKWLGQVLIVALISSLQVAAQTPPSPPGSAGTPDSEARVQAAVDATAACKGTKGTDRETALDRAARLWEGIISDFGMADRPLGARAAWEAGELWRRKGDLAAADRCYERALSFDEGRYRERATSARADMARRQERYDDAIALYREVVSMRPESARAHEARLRIGRCFQAKGDPQSAVRTFREALDAAASTPRRAVDAGNALAKALVDQGDLDGAEDVLDRVESIARTVLEAGGEDADRLRKALDEMSARRALQRARDDRDDAGKSAEALDADQRSGR